MIPYTSIIEQNADVFREALGDEQIIEHHSSLVEDDTSPQARLAAENWDAPVVVTTSVQFFESLFAAKPGRCRKLHNIAGSVVVLDEAQLIPVEYLSPILQTMNLLSKRYNVTFVISTATQPALQCRDDFKEFKGLPKDSVREIIPDVPRLYRELKRATVQTPQDWSAASDWDDLAAQLSEEESVLCVVNDRKSCRELHQKMPSGTFHLSALMCGQHRSVAIAEIKQRLTIGEPVRVISTQLVEAGVDLDFPVVYRALAGLDSIAQAAGRCNREGKLSGMGRVVVFIPPKKAPRGILRKAAETATNMLMRGLSDPLEHSCFERFFSELYWKANSLDCKDIIPRLRPDPDCCAIQFRTAAEKFRIIDDSSQRKVLVRYGEGDQWIDMLKAMGPERWLMRRLQRYAVNVYTSDVAKLLNRGIIEEVIPNVYAMTTRIGYDADTGLVVDDTPDDPEAFIC